MEIRLTHYREIIQSKDATTGTTGERLEAGKLLWKIRTAATKGKARGRAFAKRAICDSKGQQERLDRLLSGAGNPRE